MAHHSVLIMIKSINCRKNSLRCRPHSSFFKKLSDCGIFKAFPEVHFSSWKAPLAYIRRVGASHQQHVTISEYCSDRRNDCKRDVAALCGEA